MKKQIFVIFLCLFSFIIPAEARTVKIFVTNDVHGYIAQQEPQVDKNQPGRIGYAYLKGYINESEADVKFLMDAGDTFSGNVYARMDYGQTIARLMGRMDYRYITPGNHAVDFNAVMGTDDYYSQLIDTLRTSQWLNTDRTRYDLCIAVAQNFCFKNGKPVRNNLNKPVIIYDETTIDKNGLRIIVTGILTPTTFSETNKNNLFELTFGDKRSILRNLARSVQPYDRENDIVLVLSHVGDMLDEQGLLGKDIAKVKNVDIVVDSHSHNLRLPEKVNGSLYMIAGCYLEYFVELTIDDNNQIHARIVDYEKTMQSTPDREIAELVSHVTNDGEITKVIGTLPQGISFPWKNNETRLWTTDLGRFTCALTQNVAGADLAILNGGSIRGALVANPVRKIDVFNVFPLMSNVVTIRMSASEIKELFTDRFALPDIFVKQDGGFPQFYGMQVEIKQVGEGYIVEDIKKDGVSIMQEPDRLYLVAINSYMLSGGNDYKFNAKNVVRSDFGDTSEVFIKAFTSGYTMQMDYEEIRKENLVLKKQYKDNAA